MRLRKLFLGIILAAVGCGVAFYVFLRMTVSQESFRLLAEKKVGEFLRSKVKISEIQLQSFNRVALMGLKIEKADTDAFPYTVAIQKIVFRYGFRNLLQQNLETPSAIILASPEISFPGEVFPYALFEQMDFGTGDAVFSQLELVDGYFRYHLPHMDADLELSRVEGKFLPLGQGKYRINFKTYLRGGLTGHARIEGDVDVLQKTHSLQLHLHDVDFGRELVVPLQKVDGEVKWVNDELWIQELQGNLYGWKIFFNKSVFRLTEIPFFNLQWQVGKKEPLFSANMLFDLKNQKVSGSLDAFQQGRVPFSSQVRRENHQYIFESLQLGTDYSGAGWLDFKTGDYRVKVGKEHQIVSIVSNINGMDFRIQMTLNHIDFYGLDIVTQTKIHLIPIDPPLEKRLWKFQGIFDTDYFIVQQIPFHDFQGSFEVTPYGVKNLLGSWGNIFVLKGEMAVRESGPEAKLAMTVDGFDLKNVEKFSSKPLPKDLTGIVDGKLKIEGPLKKPEVIGNFTVKSGSLGRLEYDLGIVQFRGFPPRLEIYDSHVMKGRSTFFFDGALDLSLNNIFHGVQIRTPEKYAIWKGWEINTSQEESDVEIKGAMFPTLAVKAGSGESRKASTADKSEEEKYLVVGSKLEF